LGGLFRHQHHRDVGVLHLVGVAVPDLRFSQDLSPHALAYDHVSGIYIYMPIKALIGSDGFRWEAQKNGTDFMQKRFLPLEYLIPLMLSFKKGTLQAGLVF
jgi:hypothetical protein